MSSDKPDPGDRLLAELVLEQGDERAFRALYRRHTPYLYQFVLRTLGGSELDAEDVVQETWIRATQNLGGFRWEAPLRSWLTGIALNLCRNLFRRKDRAWLEAKEEFLPAASYSPEAGIDVERGLQMMPDGYRTVLLLHDVEGYKHREIAERLGTSQGTSKSQLFHARRALRALLETGASDTSTDVRTRDHA